MCKILSFGCHFTVLGKPLDVCRTRGMLLEKPGHSFVVEAKPTALFFIVLRINFYAKIIDI